MLTTALLYLLLGLAGLALLGIALAPLCLASGFWAWSSSKRDAAKADAIDRLLAER